MAEDRKHADEHPEAPPPTEEQILADAVMQAAVDHHMPEASDPDGMMQLLRHRLARDSCPRPTCRIRRRLVAIGIESLTRLQPRLAALPRSARAWRLRFVLISLRFALWMWCLKLTAGFVGLFRWHERKEH